MMKFGQLYHLIRFIALTSALSCAARPLHGKVKYFSCVAVAHSAIGHWLVQLLGYRLMEQLLGCMLFEFVPNPLFQQSETRNVHAAERAT
jgi:hypothetical protein